MTAKKAQTVSVQEEVEALLLEGKKPLPTYFEELRDEYNQLNRDIAEKEARKLEIKLTVGLQADMENITMYTVNGVNAMGFNQKTIVNVDRKKLATEFPEAFDAVTTTTQSSSFYCAK